MKNELLINILSDCKTMPELIATLINSGVIDKQFIQDMQIFSVYSRHNRLELQSKTSAVFSTSAELNISESTVWRAIRRIERKYGQNQPVLS